MTTFAMTSETGNAPQYGTKAALLGGLLGAVRAVRWAFHVRNGCHRAQAAGETLDGETIRRVVAAADAAHGLA